MIESPLKKQSDTQIKVAAMQQEQVESGPRLDILRSVLVGSKHEYDNQTMNTIVFLDGNRFIVSSDFYEQCLQKYNIAKYEVIKIKLKEIKRNWKGQRISLQSCHPYKYLQGEVEQYEEYVEENMKLYGFNMSRKRFDNLIESIKEKGFDKTYIPFIDENNVICDGQHRCCILLHMYGAEYEVEVVKITKGR